MFKIVGIWNTDNVTLPAKSSEAIRFVCISDTHGGHSKLDIPAGDVLLHAGDFCTAGTPDELEDFVSWLDTLPHQTKVVIAGNHDAVLDGDSFGKHIVHQKILQAAAEKELSKDATFATLEPAVQKAALRKKEREMVTTLPIRCKERLQRSCVYLENSSVKVGPGICIYGNAWVPGPPHWAFAKPKSTPELKAKWEAVPSDGVHILLTHTPPSSLVDAGCEFLQATLARCQPLVNVCGHLHHLYGVYPPVTPVCLLLLFFFFFHCTYTHCL